MYLTTTTTTALSKRLARTILNKARINFSIPPNLTFSGAVLASRLTDAIKNSYINHTVEGKSFAIWEIKYSDAEKAKRLLASLVQMFEPGVVTDRLLFVNNGKGGEYQCYIAAGFPSILFPQIQDAINKFEGITRNFTMRVELLLAMAIHGVFLMASDALPMDIDALYAVGHDRQTQQVQTVEPES